MIETDAVVIGAGPVGLFQAFQLGLLEIGAHIVDALPAPGGQCVELYPDKPIYDIPGIRVCSGHELADRLLEQIRPFGTALHLGQTIVSLQPQADGRFALHTSAGMRFLCRAVFIAAGVGAFQPKPLKVDGIELFVDRQVFHRAPAQAALAGQQVLVFGDDEQALSDTLGLIEAGDAVPASVTLVHRRDAFSATPDTVARMRQACADGRLRFVAAQPVGIDVADGRLTGLQLIDADGKPVGLPADTVLVLLGLSPRLGPIADWGLAMSRRQLVVDTAQFQTSVAGIHAVGDINTYAGKRKLIVCGFHEATLAAYGAAQRLRPGQAVLQQYTTTSPRLHQLLGVARG
ncbi:NAD(P)/FAD-dependent oxidoreductase [Ideonella sp. A 288]|uniref:NAD(P)/FAD-dependent oxidoreductase n=1 Tax=Ideonella sp. A 288 TaxID=1962181 RepID=UPI000B4AC6A2|nr:NAD(P)/FAD-dependent oxidoreductase [Ideonella sp. A 288]